MVYTSVEKGLHKIPECMSILLEIKSFVNICDFRTFFCFLGFFLKKQNKNANKPLELNNQRQNFKIKNL